MLDAKLDKLVKEVAKAPLTPPAFTDADVAEVGKLLVEGRDQAPSPRTGSL